MSFEEQFPILKGKSLSVQKIIELNEKVKEITGNDLADNFIAQGAITEYCLDRTKVEYEIGKIIGHSSDCKGAENCDRCWLIKELGLDDKGSASK